MMMMRVLVIGLGTKCLLLAVDKPKPDGTKQTVQVSKTERLAFPLNGTLRLMNSIGVLTVEAWDRSDVELTTLKSTKIEYDAQDRERATRELAKVVVTADRNGDDLVITTKYPVNRFLHPLAGEGGFDLEYNIKAPSNARLVVDHHAGNVNVDSLVGDIQVALLEGQILLRLPQDGRYDIHAKCGVGHVNSDFPGRQRRRWWPIGHRVVEEKSPSNHKLNLKVEIGDIVVLKTRIPKPPEPLTPVKADGS